MSTANCHHTGWLFDLYARGSEMVLWFLTDGGERLRLADPFTPGIFLSGPKRALAACVRAIERASDGDAVGWTERLDFWTGRPQPVFEVRVRNVETWRRRLQKHALRHPLISWYDADLLPEQHYCYARDVFPLARCEFESHGGRLVSLCVRDDRWATDYPVPPFRKAALAATGLLLSRHARLESLTLTFENQTTTWDCADFMLESFQEALDALDPDLILTDGGDAFVMPLLFTVAQRCQFPLRLDRDPPPQPRRLQLDGRSFMSYGRVLYQSPDYPLYGRWHLDTENSFMVEQTGLEGLFEVTRLSRLPAQRIGRRSIGTGITSIQLDVAHREGFLIPWKKTHPEAWKTARQLLLTDRGGLVYAPEVGFHENVVELDFVSMYPTIMSRFNVSPETVNCACCNNGRVPEIGYTICERRHGLVARALAPIIEKRSRYKALRKAAKESGDTETWRRCDQRQCALKWMLVCCFGYLGYRNARFGRIEAHEAVSAYARELLTVAREICEERGWRLIHAIVDCVWIVKPDFTAAEIAALRDDIEKATGLKIALEGIYRWIAFLPSRQFSDRPVPARFFGAFDDGSLKYRGIECRRRDVPTYVRAAQLHLLEQLAAGARNRDEYKKMIPQILRKISELEAELWSEEVPLDVLALRQSLSQEPEDYRGNGAMALAARQALRAGLNYHAGETIEYVIVDQKNADRDARVRLAPLLDPETSYDPVAYIRLLRRAANTLLWPAGLALEENKIIAPNAPEKAPSRLLSPAPANLPEESAQSDFLSI
ncbi:MAG: DNA polymerase domain-containing protein [bacterium]